MRKKILLYLLIPGLCLFLAPGIMVKAEERVDAPVREAIDTRQATQESEASWRLEKEKLTARFEALRQEQAVLLGQKEILRDQTDAAKTRITKKEKQLADIGQIETRMVPFLSELMGELKAQLSHGQPFLMEERRNRIEKLEALLADPETSLSEQYRKIMEALLVEAEYGFTTEVNQETIRVAGKDLLVNIFRLGRLSLFYQSLDGDECGVYNVAKNGWEPLSAAHKNAVSTAVDIAAKRQSVELLNLPVGRLVEP